MLPIYWLTIQHQRSKDKIYNNDDSRYILLIILPKAIITCPLNAKSGSAFKYSF
jgi:hypothetical protein